MKSVLGIDLGTTFSVMAHISADGKPEIIPNREGERKTPSVVFFEGKVPIVGSMAKQSASADPFRVVEFVKRQMGQDSWRFEGPDGHGYAPEEISALILKRLKDDAEAALGTSVTDAVITVPAYFNDAQRKATQLAGEIAGLNVLRIINEPTAAALAYGSIGKATAGETLMVYDLGGGTFDVTIMKLVEKDVKVLATNGHKNLGGFDWDNELLNFLSIEFKKKTGADLLDDPVDAQTSREKSELAKRILSTKETTNVVLSAAGRSASIPVSRKTFEALTQPLMVQTEHIMEMALDDAKLGWREIDKVLLVGGSTRMPAVSELLRRVSGKSPSTELHPDEVVALGAALLGAFLPGPGGQHQRTETANLPVVRISDVNSHSLGVLAVDATSGRMMNSIIIRKDTPIPAQASEMYQTIADQQTQIDVEITEGEDSDPENVTIVGKGTMEIPLYPRGAPIEVIFAYDVNGIVNVKVWDRTANRLLGELRVLRKSNLSQNDIQEMKNRIAAIEIS